MRKREMNAFAFVYFKCNKYIFRKFEKWHKEYSNLKTSKIQRFLLFQMNMIVHKLSKKLTINVLEIFVIYLFISSYFRFFLAQRPDKSSFLNESNNCMVRRLNLYILT